MNFFKLSTFFLLWLVSVDTIAEIDVCHFSAKVHLNAKIQTGRHADGTCYISVSPDSNKNLVYRSHVFNSKGQHMVFNSLGTGPSGTHTGAKVFYYHLNKPKLGLKLYKEHVVVSYSKQLKIIFNAKTGKVRPQSIGIKYYEAPEINESNNGGIEIKKSVSTFFDFGFTLGDSPLADLSRPHKVKFPNGNFCVSKNSDLVELQRYNTVWKYQGYSQVENYLNEYCPM